MPITCTATIATLGRHLRTVCAAALLLAPAFGIGADAAGAEGLRVPVPQPILTSNELLGEAAADECFVDVGVDYPPMNPDGTCPEGVPKTNESYVWGLTEEGGKLWFGTIANAGCVVARPDMPPTLADAIDSGRPVVCEYGESQYARTFPALPDAIGDWRPPSIYEYDLRTEELHKRELPDPLINRTVGFRGAGSLDNIAFLAGPHLIHNSVNIFAFQADTGDFLGSCELRTYSYIRGWADVNGVLYVGAGTATNGAVLRWDGDADSFGGDFCQDFTEVGRMTAYAASLALYHGGDGQDRLAATTEPIRNGVGVGLWISPPLGADGLMPADADHWRLMWTSSNYEPDLLVASYGYMGGALAYYDGWLYWGTMHQPGGPERAHENCTAPFCFGPPADAGQEEILHDAVYRTATVWRARNLENPQTREIQLLYGETELPACTGPGTFELKPTGWTPLYGPSGFGTRSNQYIWQMAVLDGRLYVGTYDAAIFQGSNEAGADLWRFDSADGPAVNENYTGLGDRLNYGIRGMIALDDNSGLIVGTANQFNLVPGGGWELRRLQQAQH